MKEIKLLSAAWYGDNLVTLHFPASWQVTVVGEANAPALTPEMRAAKFSQPIGSPRLMDLARNRKRAAIIIDDLTRPTPVADLLPFILDELKRAGLAEDAITIVVAGGTHPAATKDEIDRKLGGAAPTAIKVIAHDCQNDLIYLGQSSHGTPLYVNQAVMACDLKIGVGCIYPHPAAGFSGGSKIVMPGVCGLETTRLMHDYLQGADRRGGSIETELRREIDEVAAIVGLDFIVNGVLNQERRIAGLFVGDKTQAFQQGVAFAAEFYQVNPVKEADIVVADMYPFDLNLQFAHDRGIWPLLHPQNNVSKVIIAACPLGRGSHDLYPVSNPLWTRLTRRLKSFQLKDFHRPLAKLKIVTELWRQKQLEVLVLSSGIRPSELESVFPKAKLYQAWSELLAELEARHPNLPVKVAVYKCAPLQMPISSEKATYPHDKFQNILIHAYRK